MSIAPLRWLWTLDRLDTTRAHPVLGTVVGLGLVLVLIPLLSVLHGAGGPLGASLPLFFLIPVLFTATLAGRGAGAIVSCVALAAWDWFFIPPLHRATIASARDLVALLVFLLVALLTGQLATVARRRAAEALRRAESSEALYDLSVALIGRRHLDDVLTGLAARLRETFDLAACAVLLPPDGDTQWHTATVAGQLSSDLRVEESRNTAAIAAYVSRQGQSCTVRENGARVQFLPLRAGHRSIGVLELVHPRGEPPDPEREQLLETLANGIAIALEQERLFNEEQAAELARESDRLKSALLSSVSHDLRTPLAGIKAAASSLLQEDVQWSDQDRRAFLLDVDRESDRLSRLVSNLLDLSRIEAGALRPLKEWEDVSELIDRVLARLDSQLVDHPVQRTVADDLPAIRIDAVQMEQVLTNLIENAAKYSPTGSPIAVGARIRDEPSLGLRLELSVTDQGAGIPRAEQTRIFDTFYRLAGAHRRGAGTGMGLAIVKGLVEAHGGRVGLESAPGKGSTFTVSLPYDRPPSDAEKIPWPVAETIVTPQ